MKKFLFLTISFLSFALLAAKTNYGNDRAEYMYSYDGDTITINIPEYPPIIGEKIIYSDLLNSSRKSSYYTAPTSPSCYF